MASVVRDLVARAARARARQRRPQGLGARPSADRRVSDEKTAPRGARAAERLPPGSVAERRAAHLRGTARAGIGHETCI